jgi:hypothetical protein
MYWFFKCLLLEIQDCHSKQMFKIIPGTRTIWKITNIKYLFLFRSNKYLLTANLFLSLTTAFIKTISYSGIYKNYFPKGLLTSLMKFNSSNLFLCLLSSYKSCFDDDTRINSSIPLYNPQSVNHLYSSTLRGEI